MRSDWEFSHSGIFARDFDKTVQYYKYLGLAPDLGTTENPFSSADKTETTVFGKVQPPRDPASPYFLQLLYIGDLELEVLHAPAESPQGDALAYGEGVNHVCFNVPDIDGETDKLVKKGAELILDFKLDGARLEDYLDTREFGNILLSLRTPQTEEAKSRKAGYGIVDWKFLGHTAVVRDVDATVEYYQHLNIAEFRSQTMFDSSLMTEDGAYGKLLETTIKAKASTVQIGPVMYDFVQPVQGESLFKEFMERKGEGIIDLVFSVSDLEKETAGLVDKGVPIILSGKFQSGTAFTWFDTRRDGGDSMIKLIQR